MRVAIIPARGGSQRIHRKNIRNFHGKPIIAYSIEAAKGVLAQSGEPYFERIAVSTEDPEIARIASQYGAMVVNRPIELAEIGAPDCGTNEVTRHALVTLGVTEGLIACVYPCAPMLTSDDIAFVLTMVRQCSWPPYFYIPGMVYGGRAEAFLNRIAMDPHDDKAGTGAQQLGTKGADARYIDINTPEDWDRAEQMYAALQGVKGAA